MKTIWIATGGVVGVLLRWGTQQSWVRLTGLETAWATLAINTLGSGVMAWIMSGVMISGQSVSPAQQALTVGLLGGFTTFSAYSWDSLNYFQRGQWSSGIIYALGSPLLGIVAAALVFGWRTRI
jgi:CrcB protein